MKQELNRASPTPLKPGTLYPILTVLWPSLPPLFSCPRLQIIYPFEEVLSSGKWLSSAHPDAPPRGTTRADLGRAGCGREVLRAEW